MLNAEKNTLKKLMTEADECYENQDYNGAIEYFKKCIEIDVKNAFLYNFIGHLYSKIDEYGTIEEQIKYAKLALEIDPNYSSAVRNLAFAYSRAEMDEKAVQYFEKLLFMEPIPDDYFMYACRKIKLKDFELGWKFYEYRFWKKYGRTEYPSIDKPYWKGEDISDKTLLVQYEQGFGDSIQFSRYLKRVKPLAKKIIFRVQDELLGLMKLNMSDIEIIGESTPVNQLKFDYHIALMSLMYTLKEKYEDIPMPQGYIKADKEKIINYKKHFFDNDCLKIGISWQGMQAGNTSRDIPLRYFYPITKLNNVKVYSFQKDFTKNQITQIPEDMQITYLGETFKDFSDTAAAMANVDLFITSDNSVLNLAGAMGKDTFLLLNKNSEWRWFLDEEKTPWYNSVRIFKKNSHNEKWDVLFERVVETISNQYFKANGED